MNGHSVRVGIVQEPPVYLNIALTVEKLLGICERLAEESVEIAVFPETWLPGYPVWLDEAPKACLWDYPPAKRLYRYLHENSLEHGGSEYSVIAEAARKLGMHVIVGAHERDGGTIYNSTFTFSPDGNVYSRRKLTPTYTERVVWGMGDGSGIFAVDSPYGAIGGLICWEHWLPLARAAMHSLDEVIHTAQFPTVHERHQIASRHYAFEGQCFVLASGCVLTKVDMLAGFDSLETNDMEVRTLLDSMRDGFLMRGGSAIIAPNADYIAGPVFEISDTVVADLDLRLQREGNLLLDTEGHYSRPDVFSLTVNTEPRENVRFSSKKN
ncbi:MAG: carbon-nitrogen hydrolase family protein [Pyrinomonadaceae bacterium]